jgi:Tfp pilus assembly protein FimT
MHIEDLGKKSDQEINAEMKRLLNTFSSARQQALDNGATDYGDPSWAEAAACESWVQALMANTDENEMARINHLVHELIDRAS